MTRPRFLFLIPLIFSALLLAQGQEVAPRPSMEHLTASIHGELESHGDRVPSDGVYAWNTRLNKIEGCRAELLVQVHYTVDDQDSFRSDTVTFSLGSIERYEIDLQKNWLDLPCAHKDKCIFTMSNCRTRTRSGVAMDCATQNWQRAESFRLELDGDDAAASRLEKAFRNAVDLCHVPEAVAF